MEKGRDIRILCPRAGTPVRRATSFAARRQLFPQAPAPGDRMTMESGMARALTLARLHLGSTAPNPAVGAVLLKDGHVIGEGSHRGPGFPHAEAAALDDARSRGHDPRGSTLFVTLEPCCHDGHGKRTPPCAQRLVREGVAAVYAAVPDPHPRVQGRGMALLAAAGIETHWGPFAAEGAQLIADFAAWVTNRPFITLKWAQSLDARIAGPDRWITGEPARRLSHELRAAHDTIAVGAGTLRIDNPRLTVRPQLTEQHATARPRRLIFAGAQPLPESAEVFTDAEVGLTWVLAPTGPVLDQARRLIGDRALEWDGDQSTLGGLLLNAGFYRVLVEGGTALLETFLHAGLWDRAAVFVAPRFLGKGLVGPTNAAGPLDLVHTKVTPVGTDVLIEGWNPTSPSVRAMPEEALCSPV